MQVQSLLQALINTLCSVLKKMSTSFRKISRSTGSRSLGINKQNQVIQNRKSGNLSVDGESKPIAGSVIITPVIERSVNTLNKKQVIIENISKIKEDRIGESTNSLNHSSCNKLIQELKEQINELTKEVHDLGVEIKIVSSELSITKDEKENIRLVNTNLKKDIFSLESFHSTLSENHRLLSNELKTNKEKWKEEKIILEKTIIDITKELEAKIIEIRAKHREEVLELEEKNRLLKVHLSDNIKMNSWERQKEIGRMSNDLEKSLENEGNLKMQLSRLITEQKGGDSQYCHRCREELIMSLKSQEKKVNKEKELKEKFREHKNNH